MRIRHLQSMEHLVRSDPTTLAQEYDSVVRATEHEFLTEASRWNYAALIHAYGLFTYQLTFAAAVRELGTPGVPPTPIHPVCGNCGSDNVARDALAAWNKPAQAWELSATYDCTTCLTCEAEGDDLAIWLPITPSEPITTTEPGGAAP